MDLPPRDGDGYLLNMSDWSEEVARAMAAADNYELTDQKWEMIMKAREYYEEYQSVPPCASSPSTSTWTRRNCSTCG